jgi:hypothetical protein
LVHQDIAARNVFVTRDLTGKLGDFGLTERTEESKNYVRLGMGVLIPIRVCSIHLFLSLQFLKLIHLFCKIKSAAPEVLEFGKASPKSDGLNSLIFFVVYLFRFFFFSFYFHKRFTQTTKQMNEYDN